MILFYILWDIFHIQTFLVLILKINSLSKNVIVDIYFFRSIIHYVIYISITTITFMIFTGGILWKRKFR